MQSHKFRTVGNGKVGCLYPLKSLKKMANQTMILSILMIFLASAPLLALPTVHSQATSSFTPNGHPPTFVGSAGKVLLTGPMTVTPSVVTTSTSAVSSVPTHASMLPWMPYPTKPLHPPATAPALPQTVTVPPVVSCPGPSCDAVSASAGGATTQPGLNAYDSLSSYGFEIEPPDQALCAGNSYVMEVNNMGELRLFNAATLAPGAYLSLQNLMGLTGLGWSSAGDISCIYDYANGGHWFITEIVSESSLANAGPFGGCFIGLLDTCLEGIAVSVTDNPTGAYYVYFLNPNAVNTDPGQGYLLNDFAKIATTKDALMLFYDEFNLNPSTYPTCPAFGCYGFNGAQEFAFTKNALEAGLSTSSPSFNVAYENMGTDPALYPIPANPPFQSSPATCFSGPLAGAVCWYAVIPAESAESAGTSQYDNSYGGTGFMLGALDYIGLGDNRMSAFYWTGLSNLLSPGCSACSGINFGSQLLTGLEAYMDEGGACSASGGNDCGLGQQKAGPVPLGANCGEFSITGIPPKVLSCPESGIATNGDSVTQVSYAQDQIWGAIPTLITQQYTSPSSSETHVGAAYWVIGTASFDSSRIFTLTGQGYATAMHEDMEFPAIAGGGAKALMVFTLSGPDYYPSTAFGEFTATSNGFSAHVIHIADLGMAPQDGFTEYFGYPPAASRPRWGDYSWAVYVPSTNTVYFASNYIESPACGNFISNPTCGGTRGINANWGTSVNSITP